jgi:hemerythrin
MSQSLEMSLPDLPIRFMNEDHAHARELMDAMVTGVESGATDLSALCRAFYEHNREHFGREEAAMQATGFPPYDMHKSEHARALDWLDTLAKQAESDPVSPALHQAICVELPDWYLRHIQTMDTVTASWIAAHSAD